jgi:choloylglycine hydrolase
MKNRFNSWMSAILLVIFALGSSNALTCSDVILDKSKTLGGEVASARTLDFPGVYFWGTELVRIPRGVKWTSNNYLMGTLLGFGRHWENRYGFIGVDFLGKFAKTILNRRIFFDGMNEKGLSAAWLWLDETRFPAPGNWADPRGLFYGDLVAWILGQYTSVAEVRDALSDAQPHICSSFIMDLGDVGGHPVFPIHLVVHDAEGKSLIAEWHEDLGGKPRMHLYSGDEVDTVGVLTNSPTYGDQTLALGDYGFITNMNGLAGLPGGDDSESRFVRLAKLREFFDKPIEPADPEKVSAAMQALHAINNVDVGLGAEYDPFFEDPAWNPFFYQTTGVTLVRDHTNRILYFKGLHNQSLRKIDIKGVDFSIPWKGWDTETDLPADIRPSESTRYEQAIDVTAQISAPQYRYFFKPSDRFHYRFDLALTVQVAAADEGKSGSYYIYGIDRKNDFWNWTGPNAGWRKVSRDAMRSCDSGRLKTKLFEQVFVDASATEWQGLRVFAGYGRSPMDMLLGGTVREVFMVETEPRFQEEPLFDLEPWTPSQGHDVSYRE